MKIAAIVTRITKVAIINSYSNNYNSSNKLQLLIVKNPNTTVTIINSKKPNTTVTIINSKKNQYNSCTIITLVQVYFSHVFI